MDGAGAAITVEDTVTGFLLAGVGDVDLRRRTNFLVVDSKTTTRQIENAFKDFTAREDVAIIMISQYSAGCPHAAHEQSTVFTGVQVANMIRPVVQAYTKPVPAVLEIPSKDCPYDPTQDSILSRVQFMFGAA